MKSRFNYLVIMIAFAILSMSMLAVAENVPVSLNYRKGAQLGNNPQPSRGLEIPLSVVLDDVLQELIVEDPTGGEYTYYILNESEVLETQGVLDFSNVSSQTIDLGLFESGTYYLVVTYNGTDYVGIFEIVD